MTQPSFQNRIVLVTGASRGIGAAVAKRFGELGAHVILVARTMGGLEEIDDAIRASGGQATLVPMDLRDVELIDRLGASIHERWGKLDILVGNAGFLGNLTPVHHADPKQFGDILAINYTANYRLIRSLDPLLRQSDAGRAIFVTSGAAQPSAYWGAYGASKAALEHLVLTYAQEVEGTKLRVNLLDPGVVRTAMRASAFPGENAASLPPPEAIVEEFIELASPKANLHGRIIRTKLMS